MTTEDRLKYYDTQIERNMKPFVLLMFFTLIAVSLAHAQEQEAGATTVQATEQRVRLVGLERPWLETYQTAVSTTVSALIGFAGVILVLNRNAKLAREQIKLQAQEDRNRIKLQRGEDRLKLIAALDAELGVLEGIMERNSADLSELSDYDTYYIAENSQYLRIYDTVIDKLELLDADTITSLIETYGMLKEIRTRAALLHGVKFDAEKGMMVPIEHAPLLGELFKINYNLIVETRKALSAEKASLSD